jgi:hypothetical protein
MNWKNGVWKKNPKVYWKNRNKKWYAEHKDISRERNKKWHLAHKKQHAERVRKYYANNKEKCLERQKCRRQERKEYYQEYEKMREKLPSRIAQRRYHNACRRARKNKAEGSHTFGEWELLKKQYNYTCPACNGKEPNIILSEDHIIPLSKDGSNYIENIQPLCRSCNCKKHTTIIKFQLKGK